MTNHWNDIANSDCMIMIGSNPAENHPAAFGWILEAKARGAKLISLDPRFTRSSAKADIYAHLRSGTDVALIGGMIKYVLDDMGRNPQNYNMTYVSEYTNASFLINPDFMGPVDLDGIFSGYDSENRKYDKSISTPRSRSRTSTCLHSTSTRPPRSCSRPRATTISPWTPSSRSAKSMLPAAHLARRAPSCTRWAPRSTPMARR